AGLGQNRKFRIEGCGGDEEEGDRQEVRRTRREPAPDRSRSPGQAVVGTYRAPLYRAMPGASARGFPGPESSRVARSRRPDRRRGGIAAGKAADVTGIGEPPPRAGAGVAECAGCPEQGLGQLRWTGAPGWTVAAIDGGA